MSGLSLFLQAGSAPSDSQLPSSTQALLDFIAQYMDIGGTGTFNGINFGSNTPPPQNRSLPWFKTDTSGNPIGLFAWNGAAWVTTPTIVANGPTSMRPSSPANGAEYYDTTIGGLILWNASANNWTTASGIVGDIKEVTALTITAALAANPGWLQHIASSGCVIGAADSNPNGPATAHAQGALIGEEGHTIGVNELPAHAHALPYGTYTGAFQNGSQPSGVFPAVTPGGTGIAVVNTASAGAGAAANVIQPTLYLFRLYKSF